MNRGEIRSQIRFATMVQSSDVSDADLNMIINQGLQEIASSGAWSWLEASEDISLVEDQQKYTLTTIAADFNNARALVDVDNDNTIPYLSPSMFFYRRGADADNTGTTPEIWTIWGNDIYLSPTPAADDTDRLILFYYKTPTPLGADDASPAFNTGFHWILVEYGKWKLWERQEYFDAARNARFSYIAYLREMMRFYNERVQRPPFVYGDGISIQRRPNIIFPVGP